MKTEKDILGFLSRDKYIPWEIRKVSNNEVFARSRIDHPILTWRFFINNDQICWELSEMVLDKL